MKKKLFVCLLALVLLVAVAAFAVQAETQAEICPHCQKAMGQYYLDILELYWW